jgi:hypothetical protein
MTVKPRFRIGEPICIISDYELSLPVCYKQSKNKFARYHENPIQWLGVGKELFCKIPAKTAVFGYACAYDDSSTVVHAGAEWNEEEKLSLFAMVCVGSEPHFIRIEDHNPCLYKVVNEEMEIIEDMKGVRQALRVRLRGTLPRE